jgi:hypothetical protein
MDDDFIQSVTAPAVGTDVLPEAEAGAESAKKQRGRPKGKGRSKAQAKGQKRKRDSDCSGGSAHPEDDKKCRGHCRKTLSSAQFDQDNHICKQRKNEKKKIAKLAKDQGQTEWLKNLQAAPICSLCIPGLPYMQVQDACELPRRACFEHACSYA